MKISGKIISVLTASLMLSGSGYSTDMDVNSDNYVNVFDLIDIQKFQMRKLQLT